MMFRKDGIKKFISSLDSSHYSLVIRELRNE
jgi:hypothetical protein